jgi:hypothetical protein
MQPTLLELLDNGLLTPEEAQELEGYVTANPQTYWQAPQALRDKAWMGLALLEAERPGPPH